MIIDIKELPYEKGIGCKTRKDFDVLPEHKNISDCIHIIVVKYLDSIGLWGKVTYKLMSKDWGTSIETWRSDKKTFNVWIVNHSKKRIFHDNQTYYTAMTFSEAANE